MSEIPSAVPPAEPPRRGMAPWAKWTLVGCTSCLILTILVFFVGGFAAWHWFSRNVQWEMVDVSNKPDLPLSATAGQLLPPRVGAFTRTRVGKPAEEFRTARGWQGEYVSGNRRVSVVVIPTSEARDQRPPFGGAPPRSRDPNTGFHMSMNIRGNPTDVVMWSKPNWTFMIQSPDRAAMEFVRAYRPGPAP